MYKPYRNKSESIVDDLARSRPEPSRPLRWGLAIVAIGGFFTAAQLITSCDPDHSDGMPAVSVAGDMPVDLVK